MRSVAMFLWKGGTEVTKLLLSLPTKLVANIKVKMENYVQLKC